MPLTYAENGREVQVIGCHLKGDAKRHMESLGFTPGAMVIPISNRGGNMIVQIKEARLALGVGAASKIMVK